MNTIIIGTNHNNTLGLLWSLGAAGHTIILLLYGSDCNYVKASKYVSRTYLINKGEDVITLLKEVSKNMDSKPIVFVSNDKDATLLNDHFSELSAYCYFEGGRPDGGINLYRDKDEGEKLAQKCGFTIPQTVVITKPEELASVALPYPLFIKGNNSVHGGKAAMKKCDNQEAAEEFVNGLPQDYFPLQVQEFIEKEYELMLLGCSLYGGKKIICPVANKKIRQYPKNTGGGSWSLSVEVAGNEELRQLAARVELYLQEIEYTGNFSAEFLYANGKFYFLEINLRNDGTSWLSTCSGFNLPDMVCRSFVDENVTADNCTFRQRHYMNIMWDVNYWIDGTLSLKQWRSQFNNDTCYSHYNKNDIKPWKCFFGHPLTTMAKLVIKKILYSFKHGKNAFS